MGAQRKPMPPGFEEDANLPTSRLAKKYKSHHTTVDHWKRDLGIVPDDTKKKPVLQFTKGGELVKRYPSIREAATAMYGNRYYITCSCKGKVKSAYGFIWRYEDES